MLQKSKTKPKKEPKAKEPKPKKEKQPKPKKEKKPRKPRLPSKGQARNVITQSVNINLDRKGIQSQSGLSASNTSPTYGEFPVRIVKYVNDNNSGDGGTMLKNAVAQAIKEATSFKEAGKPAEPVKPLIQEAPAPAPEVAPETPAVKSGEPLAPEKQTGRVLLTQEQKMINRLNAQERAKQKRKKETAEKKERDRIKAELDAKFREQDQSQLESDINELIGTTSFMTPTQSTGDFSPVGSETGDTWRGVLSP